MMFPKSLNWMIYKVSGKWVSDGPMSQLDTTLPKFLREENLMV